MTRAMKDSGIEWIGQIPEDWKIRKIGDYFSQRMTKVSDKEYKPLSVTKKGIVLQLDTAAKSDNHENRKLVLKGDFVINSRSDRKLSSGLSDLDGSVSLINIVIFSETVSKRYTNYLLKNMAFAEEFYRWGTGIVSDLWSTKWDKMKKILIPIPSLEEQEQIASILDKKVERIDAIIADTKQSIEELKKYKQSLITETVTKGLDKNVPMKDSGIEWIGQIPENWEVVKLKRLVKISGNVKKCNAGEDYIGLENVRSFEGKLNSYQKLSISSEKQICYKGDILYSKLRPYLSKGFIAEKECACSGEFVVLKSNNKILPMFLLKNLLTIFTEYINATTYGTKMPRTSWEKMKEVCIIVPPLEDQSEIVDFLENKVQQIEQLIQDKEQLILQYEEYKKSIIYEYVTGKIEI